MAKRIHHMGMIMAQGEHDDFHRRAPDLSPKQHEGLMKRMGITKEQDEEWHRNHLTLGEQRVHGLKQVDPSDVSAGFVQWCVKQGWLIQRGKQYFASREGLRNLGTQFDIAIAQGGDHRRSARQPVPERERAASRRS